MDDILPLFKHKNLQLCCVLSFLKVKNANKKHLLQFRFFFCMETCILYNNLQKLYYIRFVVKCDYWIGQSYKRKSSNNKMVVYIICKCNIFIDIYFLLIYTSSIVIFFWQAIMRQSKSLWVLLQNTRKWQAEGASAEALCSVKGREFCRFWHKAVFPGALYWSLSPLLDTGISCDDPLRNQ